MIKNIIFDFGGVLGSDADDFNNTHKNIPKILGLSLEKVDELFDKHWKATKHGKEPWDEFLKDLIITSGKTISLAKVRKMYKDNISINTEVYDFAKELKKSGYKLYVIANESKLGMDTKISKFRLKKVFKKIYNSADLGFSKPEKKIYDQVIKETKIKPKETIFIDNAERNLVYPQQIGIHTVYYKNIKQAKKEVEKTIKESAK